MRIFSIVSVLSILLAAGDRAGLAQTFIPDMVDSRVESLLERMTLEEKVGQMTQLTLQAVSSSSLTADSEFAFDEALLREAVVTHGVGSIFNTNLGAFSLEDWQETVKTIQDLAVNETRLGIPVIYGIDAVHGHNYMREGTVFPQNLSMAATFNPDLVREAYEIAAIELRASGISWNFAPVLDIGRQPLWSRFFETFGEDVFLTTTLGVAATLGNQADDIGARGRVAATAKHYLGYGFPLSGKDRTPAWIPERQLRDLFLPPFRAAINAGIATVMVSSGEINGIPVHASHYLLTQVLRYELGFNGVVVTDWEDIWKLHTLHHVAEDRKEAVRLAVTAGIDMSMVPNDLAFHDLLIELVREGTIPESRIDASVRRILRLKTELGLFDNAYHDSTLVEQVASPAFREVSLRAAQEAITLLKNENNVLPLGTYNKLLVTGPAADSKPMLHGGWSYTWQGTEEAFYPEDTRTLLGALQETFGESNVTYAPGATINEVLDLDEVGRAATSAEAIVLALGGAVSVEKPGDIEALSLPDAQVELAKTAAETGKPVVLVLLENRPLIINQVEPLVDAVIWGGHPGMFGGEAIAGVLAGTVNPSGRLPFTYPRATGSLVPYDHKYTEKLDVSGGMEAYNPQYAFGEGLSYTVFEYEDLEIEPRDLRMGETAVVSVSVTNTGNREGKEVVQLYLSDLYADITPVSERLKGFEKISLEAGERATVRFLITPEDMSFIGRDNRPVVEPGEFDVRVGPLSGSFVIR